MAMETEDIESDRRWVIHIKTALKDAKLIELSAGPSIFMAPSPLRGLKHEAFVPQVVAIGPYHSDLGPHHSSFPQNQETERFKAIAAKEMEKHKVMASKFVEFKLKGKDFSILIDKFVSMLPIVREAYDTELESCNVDEKLAYMLALDASFVVEVLKSTVISVMPRVKPGSESVSNGNGKESELQAIEGKSRKSRNAVNVLSFHDYYCSRFPRPLRKSLLQDFVLLENQLPLSLLLEVLNLQDEDSERIMKNLVQRVAKEVLPFFDMDAYGTWSAHPAIHNMKQMKHLLDCLYCIVTHNSTRGSPKDNDDWLVQVPTHFPRAVDLHNSGIAFKSMEYADDSLRKGMIGVSYDPKRAILYLPRIRVGDDTERLFRNLVAYESHLLDEVALLSYLRFMNSLVDAADDVALLVEKGVIVQDIGTNEEVADMWNNLCVNTMRVCSVEYDEVAQQLAAHCKKKTNALKSEFKRTYLSRPWLVVSVLSAASLLIMTLIIVIYTIALYKKPGG